MRGSLYRADDDAGRAGAGRDDLVVLHHGFASTRTEGLGLFVGLARALCARGFAIASFDRRAHGESDGDFADITIDTEIEDAVGSVEWLSTHPAIEARAVHLVGMSMGAVIASVAAARARTPVASLVLWSPAAVFADEFRGGTVQGRPLADLERDGYVDFLGLRLSRAYVEAAIRFDPYGAARGFSGPVRVLHGADDAIVPTSYALRYGDLYGDRADVTVVADADHGWASVRSRAVLYEETVRFLDLHGSDPATPTR
jgi:hypothetical protein